MDAAQQPRATDALSGYLQTVQSQTFLEVPLSDRRREG